MINKYRAWDAEKKIMYGCDFDYLFLADGTFKVMDGRKIIAASHEKSVDKKGVEMLRRKLELIRCSGMTDRKKKLLFEHDAVECSFGEINVLAFGEYDTAKDQHGFKYRMVGWHIKMNEKDGYPIVQDGEEDDEYCEIAGAALLLGSVLEHPELIADK